MVSVRLNVFNVLPFSESYFVPDTVLFDEGGANR